MFYLSWFVLCFSTVFLGIRLRKAKTQARIYWTCLLKAYSDQEIQNKRHSKELADERSLNTAVIDMLAVESEMNALEDQDAVDDLIDSLEDDIKED